MPSPSPVFAGPPLRLGALFPLSGPASTGGGRAYAGATIARDLANAAGGVCGRPVEFVTQDALDPAAAAIGAGHLASVERVPLVITDTSAVALSAGPILEQARVVAWETEGEANEVTGRSFQYVFRPVPSVAQVADQAAAFLTDVVSPRLAVPIRSLKIAIVAEDGGYGTQVATDLAGSLRARGISPAATERYSAIAQDVSDLVARLRTSARDAVIAASFSGDSVLLARQLKSAGVTVPAFIGTLPGAGSDAFRVAMGDEANGVLAVGSPQALNPDRLSSENRRVFDAFMGRALAQSGGAPATVNPSTLVGFVSTWTLLQEVLPGACAGGLTADAIRTAALTVDVTPGAAMLAGGLRFAGADAPNAGQNRRAIPAVHQWQQGILEVVYPDALSTSLIQGITR